MEEYTAATSEQEVVDDRLCKKCRKHCIDNSESEYSILCSECRNEQIKYPFPRKIVAFFVFLLAACVISLIQFGSIMDEYKTILLAEKAYEDGYYYTANKLYRSIYNRNSVNADTIGGKVFETAIVIYDYEQASEMFSRHLYNKEVSDREYNRIMPFVQKLTKYSDLLHNLESYGITNETSDDEMIAIISAVPDDEKTLIDKYLLANRLTLKEEYAAALLLLEDLLADQDNDCIDVLPQIASCYRHLGEYDKARKYAEDALSRNKDNYEAIRQIAVVEMLLQDYEAAVREAEKAFEICPDGQFIADVLALSYYLSHDSEGLSAVIDYAATHDLLIDSYHDVSQGVKTVEDIYIEGE